MNTKQMEIINKLGLHARAAAKLVSIAQQFNAEITLQKDGQSVNAKSIMGVMMLAAGKGSRVTISAEGEGAEPAIEQICSLIRDRFGEPE